jgi:thiol-disulfide isomerase/thioredoxin
VLEHGNDRTEQRSRGDREHRSTSIVDRDDSLVSEGRLPSFQSATAWLNAPETTPAQLRGSVVLVDFWTYTCINWLRTLPYLRKWYDTYRSAGLVVVGVHTPEFEFEHDLRNVTERTRDLGVEYPVAVDNAYGIWDAFANHYWPALYLADADGHIRYHHFGEGEYVRTEEVIQTLLPQRQPGDLNPDLVAVEPHGLELPADLPTLRSPETYLGHARTRGFRSDGAAYPEHPHRFDPVGGLRLNEWDLAGDWTIMRGAVVSNGPGGSLRCRFHARDLNLVMGPRSRGARIPFRVTIDGQAPEAARGCDVDSDGRGVLADQTIYQLIRQPGTITDRLAEIEFLEPGAAAYCLTFG